MVRTLTALAALALPLGAMAAPISLSSIPNTQTYDYSWTTPAVSGTTSFTYETAVRNTAGVVCGRIPGCLTGTFSTGNNGTGVYDATLNEFNRAETLTECVNLGIPWGWFGIGETWRCPVTQTVDLSYDTTSARYLGDAPCGTVRYQWYPFFGFWVLANAYGASYSPGTFSGDLYLSGTLNGTWTE